MAREEALPIVIRGNGSHVDDKRTIEVTPRELKHLIDEGAVQIQVTSSLPIFFEKLSGAYNEGGES